MNRAKIVNCRICHTPNIVWKYENYVNISIHVEFSDIRKIHKIAKKTILEKAPNCIQKIHIDEGEFIIVDKFTNHSIPIVETRIGFDELKDIVISDEKINDFNYGDVIVINDYNVENYNYIFDGKEWILFRGYILPDKFVVDDNILYQQHMHKLQLKEYNIILENCHVDYTKYQFEYLNTYTQTKIICSLVLNLDIPMNVYMHIISTKNIEEIMKKYKSYVINLLLYYGCHVQMSRNYYNKTSFITSVSYDQLLKFETIYKMEIKNRLNNLFPTVIVNIISKYINFE